MTGSDWVRAIRTNWQKPITFRWIVWRRAWFWNGWGSGPRLQACAAHVSLEDLSRVLSKVPRLEPESCDYI